jgi:hypothetical protein
MSYRATAWQSRAACRIHLHFTDWRLPRQLAVCADCPVKTDCAQLGLASVTTVKDALEGPVYGGLHPKQFAELVRLRGQKKGRWVASTAATAVATRTRIETMKGNPEQP